MKKNSPKLSLSKETLKNLTLPDRAIRAGVAATRWTEYCTLMDCDPAAAPYWTQACGTSGCD